MEIRIIPANERHIPDTLYLLEDILRLHATSRGDLFKSEGGKYTSEQLASMFSDKSTPVFVAVDECEKMLGYIMCRIEQRGGGARREYKCLYIDDLCVDPRIRGSGVGGRLIEFAKDYARECDCFNVELNVWEFNEKAIRFYEGNGFCTQRRIMEFKI